MNDSLNSSMVEGLQKQNEDLWTQIFQLRETIRQKDMQIRSLSGDKTLVDSLEMQVLQKDHSISDLERDKSLYRDMFLEELKHECKCDHSECEA